MSDNPFESPQIVEKLPQAEQAPQIPSAKEVRGVLLFQAGFLILSALLLDGGGMFKVAVISCIAMWLILGIRWLRFRKRV